MTFVDGATHHAMVHAVTQYDRRQERADIKGRRVPNIYRLGHYLGAIERIEAAVVQGAPLRDAIARHTNDRVQAILLKAAKLA